MKKLNKMNCSGIQKQTNKEINNMNERKTERQTDTHARTHKQMKCNHNKDGAVSGVWENHHFNPSL